MKTIDATWVAGTALALVWSGEGQAADLPSRTAPTPPTQPLDWDGLYAGIHAGYLWGTFDPGAGLFDPARIESPLAGLQAGYNWRRGQFLWGVEGDMAGLDARAKEARQVSVTCGDGVCVDNYDWMAKVDALATTRARAGLLVGNVLLFATGGAAFADVELRSQAAVPVFSGPTTTYFSDKQAVRVGWAAGAGAEMKLNQHWSVGVQYLHLDFGHQNYSFAGLSNQAVGFSADLATLRLNYSW